VGVIVDVLVGVNVVVWVTVVVGVGVGVLVGVGVGVIHTIDELIEHTEQFVWAEKVEPTEYEMLFTALVIEVV
jgi:MFS superfamily sulfate permease-like transporter